MSYTETEEYQKEIAEQYKERNLELSSQEVTNILSTLGIEVDGEIKDSDAGNMNATFLAGQYVVKVSNDEDAVKYAANKIVSDQLPNEKVVRVVIHDIRKRTGYEVLVMERAPGAMWLPDMPSMSEEQNIQLFSEVLQVATAARDISVTDKFGWVTDIITDAEANGFATHKAQLEARLEAYIPKIEAQSDLDQELVKRIIEYVRAHLELFEDDKPSFVHTDLHMGNVIHQAGKLSAVIDWDSVQSVPSYRALVSLIGLIDNPAQFVEGTPDFGAYKGKKFEYLCPLLKEAFADELSDPDLALKLNVTGIIDGLMWVSQDWSREWNKEMIANLSSKETPANGDVSRTYYGEIVEKIRKF